MTSQGITTMASLQEHLYTAMILEHATIPPYLIALYSIKPGTNMDAANIMRVVAVEEMLHLTFASNLLNAIGGTVDLTKPGFVPDYPTYVPDSIKDFKIHLRHFGKTAIENFLKIERPIPPGEGVAKSKSGPSKRWTIPRRSKLAAWFVSSDAKGEEQYATIGEFYTAIKEGFEYLEHEAQVQGGTIFHPMRNQITAEYYYSGGGKLFAVNDLASATKAIDFIIEQGEGYVTDEHPTDVFGSEGELAHYYRFDQLKQGRYYNKGDKPGEPTGTPIQVDWHSVYRTKTDVKLSELEAEPELYQAAEDFNGMYASFLKVLTRAFNGKPELLTDGAMPMMFGFRDKMNTLIRNPMPGHGGHNAAPTFEIPGAVKHSADVNNAC